VPQKSSVVDPEAPEVEAFDDQGLPWPDRGLDPQQLPHPHTLTGDFRMHRNFRSRFMIKERDVLVYLPPGYDADPARRFPVLYLQDGQNLFDGATSFIPGVEWRVDETAQELITAGEIEPLLIVGIYNAGERRIHEYTPTPDLRRPAGGGAGFYGRMLVEELKPVIDARYRTLQGPEHTGLGGSSLGGLLSLYLGLHYFDVFGRLAVLSPSVWWDNRLIIRQIQSLGARPPLRIWLDVGTKEGRVANYQARLLRDTLMAKGWVLGGDLRYFEADNAPHSEWAWAERVGPMLRHLFPARGEHG